MLMDSLDLKGAAVKKRIPLWGQGRVWQKKRSLLCFSSAGKIDHLFHTLRQNPSEDEKFKSQIAPY